MAVMAIDGKQLNIAEEACAAIGRYDKVDYIHYIKVIIMRFIILEFCMLKNY